MSDEIAGPQAGEGAASVDDLPQRFSLVAGGAFHDLLGRFGLLAPDGLPSRRAALGLGSVAFLIPAAAVVLQSLLDDRNSGWDYFEDATVYARFLVSIIVMVSTERLADSRIILMTQHFRDAQLLKPAERVRFAGSVIRADRQASSHWAEWMILLLAFAWSIVGTRFVTVVSVDSWEGAVRAGGEIGLSWAGEVSAFTSNALFLFLLLRWFWRFYIWAALLWRTSKMDLQIMPLHPDRCGGLGFLAIFPGIFSGLIFALSCVIAASFHKAAPVLGDTEQILWLATAAWLVLIALIFLGPLLFFVRPLYVAREVALLEYGRLAHGHHLAFHRKWLEGGMGGEEIMGSADPSSASDLNASVEIVYAMRSFPIDRAALLQLLVSAGIPMLVMAALQMPLGDLMKLIFGFLL
jgi:hypothetical protein